MEARSFCYFCGKAGRADAPCPSCMIAMPAVFCGGCGARSSPLAPSCATCKGPLGEPRFAELPCPACTAARRASGPMVQVPCGAVSLLGCGTCRGVFVSARAWCTLLSHPELEPKLPGEAPPGAGPVLEMVACPLCKKRLERGRFAGRSSVVVDMCERHGVWLDAGELSGVLGFVRQERAARPDVDAAHASLDAARRAGDVYVRGAAQELTRREERKPSGFPWVLALVAALGFSALSYGTYQKFFAHHGETVKGAAEGAQKVLGK
ncbi:MAG: zf-TFIIB domain-containing protein [Polyangiaceae bacterium]